MTTAVYVRNTRRGCRVVHPIKTEIIGRKKFRPFKTIGEMLTPDESFKLATLVYTLIAEG